MNWLTNLILPKIRAVVAKRELPDNLWDKCPACGQMLFHRELAAHLHVCSNCGHHLRMPPKERLALLFDGDWTDIAVPKTVQDPLKFRDRKRYADRIKEAQLKSDGRDAARVAAGTIGGTPAVIVAFDFAFLGGSMGVAVGEALVTAAQQAVARGAALVVVPSSGGARMQEGILALMQMPRTTIAVEMVKERGLPYVVILADPTTGGVSASFAMLGDITLAEPGAVIGFAGARVIEETIRQKLPEGFQRAEYLLEHGMVDMVVPRRELKAKLASLLDLLMRRGARGATALTSDRVLERLQSLHPRLIDLSLDRVLKLLDRLGRPQDRLPPVIHVAGTNGKGSTLAFLRAFLEEAGYRVHVYTSPHLVRFHERIRLAGHLIEEDELLSLLEECEQVNAGTPITFFEITTAAAFLAFTRSKADVTLLEVGLGGRFDATNVIARPAVTAITPVSLDHQHFLGDTVAQIAFEKAGILKRGVPAVVAPQLPDAAAAIEARAQEVGAPLFRQGSEWRANGNATHLRYSGKRALDLPPPGLLGPHQYDNAGTALACVECLDGFTVPDAALARGMAMVEWPARLQRLTRGPLLAQLPPGTELWLDGAHNPAGGEALARVMQDWGGRTGLVFGMLSTHDPAGFLVPMAPSIGRLAAIAIPGEPNARPAGDLASAAAVLGIAAAPAQSLAEAVAMAASGGAVRVLICGSLYLAGRVLSENG